MKIRSSAYESSKQHSNKYLFYSTAVGYFISVLKERRKRISAVSALYDDITDYYPDASYRYIQQI
jgi:hypothetical protein